MNESAGFSRIRMHNALQFTRTSNDEIDDDLTRLLRRVRPRKRPRARHLLQLHLHLCALVNARPSTSPAHTAQQRTVWNIYC